jgi:hypothetical protein
MINVPVGTRILLASRPIDFRKGAHGLAALAQEVLAEDPFSGTVYRSKRADRVKILVWDTSESCTDLEAAAARVVSLATDYGRRREALTGRIRRIVRRPIGISPLVNLTNLWPK